VSLRARKRSDGPDRPMWGEASWVGVQVVAFSLSYWFFSVNRATLLWFPLWIMLGRWVAGPGRSRRLHRVLVGCAFGVEIVKEPFAMGPWALCHHPRTVDGAYALAGHEHPVYRVATRLDRARLPCFRFGARAGVLPAFGGFTGGFEVNERARGEAIYVVAGERVFGVRT